MEMTNNYSRYLDQLRSSTMFHMSLGSKELFHSNFLQWISIINWPAFLDIMHELAGLQGGERFWWENIKCDVEGCKGDYCPDNNNLEVRREYHKFDLSIYICDSVYKKRKNKKKTEDNEEQFYNEDGDEYIKRWIPVLVLENKVKSLPYKGQLENYTKKALDEWKKGKRIKEMAKKKEEGKGQLDITFILLSLMDTKLDSNDETNCVITLKDPDFIWKHKTYKDLYQSIQDNKVIQKFDGLNKNIIIDYCKFVNALYGLAKNWEITPEECYCSQIFPNDRSCLFANTKRKEIEAYRKLRIHDIHEKLLYDQLLTLLERDLDKSKFEFKRFDVTTYHKDFTDKLRIFTNSSYAHNIGIFEVKYVLAKEIIGKKEPLSLMIQVQGDNYCHMLICDKIVKEKKENIKGGCKYEIDENGDVDTYKNELDGFVSMRNGNGQRFPKALQLTTEPPYGDYHKYGENLIYQSVKIPAGVTINKVIDAIVEDIKKIDKWFRNKTFSVEETQLFHNKSY